MKEDLQYYMSLPYRVELFYHPEDNTWEATHPELGRGTCYAIGDSQEEALTLLEQDRRELFEILLDEGQQIPEPVFNIDTLPSGQIMLRIPRSLHQNVKDYAKREGVSVNQFIASVLAHNVGSLGVKKRYEKLIKQMMTEKYIEDTASNFSKNIVIWNAVMRKGTKREYVYLSHSRPKVKKTYEKLTSYPYTGISELREFYG